MGKLIFTATNQEGVLESGYLDVNSNKEGLEELREKSYQNISLHNDASVDIHTDELPFYNKKELEILAKNEIKWQKGGSFLTYMVNTLKNNSFMMAIGSGLLYYGYTQNSAMWMASGVIVATALPFFSLLNYRVLSNYENCYRKLAFGEWDGVLEHLTTLRQITKNKAILVDIDTIEAYYLAHNKDLNGALKLILPHKEFLDSKMPGMYENKMASLYLLAKEYDKSLFSMQQAAKNSNQDLMYADLAMSEVRFGSLENAEAALKKVDINAMAEYTKPLVKYIDGFISYKKGDLQSAKELLSEAFEDISEYSKNPVIWVYIAMITSLYAVILNDMGEKSEARTLLDDGVLKITSVHADDKFLKLMKDRFGDMF